MSLLRVLSCVLSLSFVSASALASVDVTITGAEAAKLSKAVAKLMKQKSGCKQGFCAVSVQAFSCDAVKIFDDEDHATGAKVYSCTATDAASGASSVEEGSSARKLWDLTIEFLDSESFHGDDTWSSVADSIDCDAAAKTCRLVRAED